jgi:hypothetical protein
LHFQEFELYKEALLALILVRDVVDEMGEVSAKPQPELKIGTPQELTPPKVYLTNWGTILQALGKRDNKKERMQVRKLHEFHPGPIKMPGQGGQPKVEKSKLLEWWDGLEKRFWESEQKERDTTATVDSQHSYGRTGTVAPEIAGEVKKRERGRKL